LTLAHLWQEREDDLKKEIKSLMQELQQQHSKLHQNEQVIVNLQASLHILGEYFALRQFFAVV